MEMKDFEEKLIQMKKPEVLQLKHQALLAGAIIKAKDKSVISWWWISIPLYLIATLLMKSFYMPNTTLISNIRELKNQEGFVATLLFIVMPIVFIAINILSIRKLYFLAGNPKTMSLFQTTWFNLLIIFFSLFILILYSQ